MTAALSPRRPMFVMYGEHCDRKLVTPTVLLLVELTIELWECLISTNNRTVGLFNFPLQHWRMALAVCMSLIHDIGQHGEIAAVAYWSVQRNYVSLILDNGPQKVRTP